MELETAVAVAVSETKPLTFAAKLAIAYEHYRFVTQAQVADFNARLKQQTLVRAGRNHSWDGASRGESLISRYDVLDFSAWKDYKPGAGMAPPSDVKAAAAVATDRGIFDVLEVAKATSEVEYHDPILFGRILGCGDRFFIAQWDSDVKIDDLIGPNEG